MCPSRDELLAIVRKHSGALVKKFKSKENEIEYGEGDGRFWQEMLDMFFVRGVVQSNTTSDDLLFFVHFIMNSESFSDDLNEEENAFTPFFVRRWQPQLDKVIGDRAWEVDWRRSFYLNLVAHTTYTLTVSICRQGDLERHRESPQVPLEPVYKITKNVYASPSRSKFQKKSSKASETVSSYPNLYFSVDDYDDTFENLILREADQCYCVLLHATGGAAFGTGRPLKDKEGKCQVTLFSGYVNYELVRSAFESEKINVGFLQLGGKSEKLVMRGPGGRGEVDVIITRVSGENEGRSQSSFPIPLEKAGSKTGIGSIVRKAAVAAKHAYLAASAGPEDFVPLRCSLLSVCLNWETLAHDLLFKGL